MLIFRDIVAKDGQIKYVKVFKLFVFVMFIFALYSINIKQFQGFDLAFVLSSNLVILLIFSGLTINVTQKMFLKYKKLIQVFQQWLQSLFLLWNHIQFVWVLYKEQTQEVFILKQRQSISCVYRC